MCVLLIELAVASGDFSQNVSDLSAADVGKQLSQSLAGLADVQRKVQDLQTIQSEQDMTTLMATGISTLSIFFCAYIDQTRKQLKNTLV